MWGELAPPTAPKSACAMVGLMRDTYAMAEGASVVVVGGGVMGCSIAFHFQPMTPPPTTTTLAPAAMPASVREVRR